MVESRGYGHSMSQCTCRCVVLPDDRLERRVVYYLTVSMHLQVRGRLFSGCLVAFPGIDIMMARSHEV